jgi:four helix bundle protein
MSYEEWLRTVPSAITSDSLWKMEVYRLALYATDIAWDDVTKLMSDRRTWGLSGQLYDSAGSVSSNIAEGYSRGTGRERARFYEYSLGSCRESRDHYYKGRHVLGDEIALQRIDLHTRIAKLLLTMIPQQRAYQVREEEEPYGASPS